ncbi:MAG: hypothetical protein F4138_08210 [Acidimicrobiia bacterium]|nr:hypothetical protein [Acidimicrobiia bacterium]
MIGCGNQYVCIDYAHCFSIGTKQLHIKYKRISSIVNAKAIVFLEEAVSDIRPGLLNIERLTFKIISASNERLQRLSVVRELS